MFENEKPVADFLFFEVIINKVHNNNLMKFEKISQYLKKICFIAVVIFIVTFKSGYFCRIIFFK